MISVGLDHTLFIQIFQFLLIVFIANKLIVNPIMSTINARNAKIDSLVKSAADNLDSINASEEAYNTKLQEARATINEYRRKVKEEADAAANNIVQKATEEITSSTKDALADLNKSCEQARASLKGEVAGLAQVVRDAVVGKVA